MVPTATIYTNIFNTTSRSGKSYFI